MTLNIWSGHGHPLAFKFRHGRSGLQSGRGVRRNPVPPTLVFGEVQQRRCDDFLPASRRCLEFAVPAHEIGDRLHAASVLPNSSLMSLTTASIAAPSSVPDGSWARKICAARRGFSLMMRAGIVHRLVHRFGDLAAAPQYALVAPSMRNDTLPSTTSAPLNIVWTLASAAPVRCTAARRNSAATRRLRRRARPIASACDNATIWPRSLSDWPKFFSDCICSRYICGDVSVGIAIRSAGLRSASVCTSADWSRSAQRHGGEAGHRRAPGPGRLCPLPGGKERRRPERGNLDVARRQRVVHFRSAGEAFEAGLDVKVSFLGVLLDELQILADVDRQKSQPEADADPDWILRRMPGPSRQRERLAATKP